MKKKIVWLPYDFDTALGINNEGSLVFGYELEDTDHLAEDTDVYNGQDSVIWNNLRDAFGAELKAMYQELRSTGALTYEKVEKMFEEHQGKWPEAIFNEDALKKYIDPLVKEGTASYLSMLQGSKKEQRKWWLYNRFRYIDSKYNAGDALSDLIQLRGYAKADVTVRPYAHIYPAVKYGSYLVSTRGQRNVETTLANPLDKVNDTEIYIYSASQLASVGDLSGLKVGFADFSMATRLQELKIGDSSPEYSNPNLGAGSSTFTLGNNVLLKKLDVRNCTALGTGNQKTVDISGCSSIEEVYFDGTAIQGLTLPNGGFLKKLHLPATMTNLTILNQKSIEEFVLTSYSNITTLRLENISSVIDTRAILSLVPASTRVRLVGVAWEAQSVSEIDELMDLLDTMRGLDEHGNNVEKAQVIGTIHIDSIRGSDAAELQARYPNLKIKADHSQANLYYYSYDGETLLYTEAINDGADGAYSGTPSRASTDQYTYTFAGWATSPNGAANANATKEVVADREVYAAYTATLRAYTITWKNKDGSVLETDINVPYGSTPQYNGSTPTYDGQTSTGWSPTPATVTGDQVYTATYIPTYTATFVRASADGGGTLYTQTNVPQGTVPTYGGETPTSTQGEDYTFTGWSPALSGITANTTYTAVFKAPSDAPTSQDVSGAYAVEWDYANSSPALTRQGLAAAFADPTPATDTSGPGSSPFDSIQPWAGMKRYNVINGEISYSQDDAGFDETLYDTVVYIPEFYYTAWKDTENSKWHWAISPTEIEGYKKHPGSGRYIGRFHMSGDANEVFSKSGAAPFTNVTQSNYRAYAHSKGTHWYMLDFATWAAVQMLYLVEYANFNSQDALGKGWNTGSVGTMGGTTGAAYHTIKTTGAHNQYRWIEDPYSNVLDWIDGFVTSSRVVYTAASDHGYAGGTSDLESTGIRLPSSAYATGIGYSEQAAWAFIPDAASGGSETSYLTDYVASNTDVRVAGVGGNFIDDAYYGMFYLSASIDTSSAYASRGSRLLYNP